MSFFPESELSIVKAPLSMIPKCGACGLLKTCRSPKMEPTGRGGKDILIVAEAPGEEEDKKGVQLVGNSGRELMKVLAKAGLDMRKDCILTNALICRPPGNKITSSRWVDYCRPNLINTIERVKPRVIVLLGGTAVESLMPYVWREDSGGGVTRWAGWKIPSIKLNAWICPTYHPAYVLREKSPVLDRLFLAHLGAVAALKDRPWEELPSYEDEVQGVQEPELAAEMITKLMKDCKVAAFDYETNMLKPDSEKSKILSCSICFDGHTTIAYPWHGEAIKATKRFIRSPIGKIVSNMKFEERWTMAKLDCRVKNWKWDTMLAAHILDNRHKITSIKFQAFVRIGADAYDGHIKKHLISKSANEANTAAKEIRLDHLLKYNALDSLLEYKVGLIQMKEMRMG